VFAIDSDTGEIKVEDGSTLNDELTPSYELTVQVTDNGGLTDSATVTISVLDGNDDPSLADATFTVAENSSNGTSVGTVSATDPDAGETFTYAITAGNDDGVFAIGSVSGEITVADGTGLDYETVPSYGLTVTVTDSGGSTDAATVTIDLSDVDEAPVIDDATFSVAEDSTTDTEVGVLTAGDPEGGTVTYSITAGNTDGAFRIEADPTPTIYVDNASVLDYETTHQYSLTVSGEDATGNVGVGTITIDITDANDAPTVADTSCAVAEGCASNTLLGTIVGKDQDDDPLEHEITAGNDAGVFGIDSSTGVFGVVDGSGLDYATTPKYSLTVQVTDDEGATGTGTLTIHVCDGWVVTITAAETTESVQFGVTSGATDGFDNGLDDETSVASPQIAIYPQAADRSTWLRRELKGSTDGSAWNLRAYGGDDGLTLTWDATAVPDTGLQMVKYTVSNYRDSRVAETTIDMATTTSLSISPGAYADLEVTPTVLNEAPTLDDVTFTVDEDSEEGTVVGTVAASDPDAGDELTYAITAGNSDGAFAIGNTSGEITVADGNVLNYELKSSYALTVTVTDDGGLSDTATVTIQVGDVDEPPIVVASTFSVAEDSPTDTYVGTLLALDPEGGTMAYSITAGDPQGAFRIEADPTPKIYVDDASALDYETTPQYSLTVAVEDVGGNVSTATITINVTDANDAPTFADTSCAVAEGCANDTVLGTLVGNDQDGDALEYEITAGNDDSIFGIDSSTGVFGVVDGTGLDYATTPEYNLTVQVTDDEGATGTGTVTVHVCDGWVVTMTAAETTESVQFGVTSGATADFDDGLDAETSAASPQIAIYPRDDVHGWLCRELKGSTNGSGWEIEVSGGTDGLTLTWDTAALPRTGLQMEETYIPAQYRDSRVVTVATIDMSETTSLYIAPGTLRTLIVTPILTEFEVPLGEGWNLVSLPIEPDDPAVDATLTDLDCWHPVWQWDPTLNDGAGSYVEATELHALVGYWIYARCATSITVYGLAPADPRTALVAGWNMVGMAADTVLPDTTDIATPVSYWSNGNCCYESLYADETLATGYGYWIYAWSSTTLGGDSR